MEPFGTPQDELAEGEEKWFMLTKNVGEIGGEPIHCCTLSCPGYANYYLSFYI